MRPTRPLACAPRHRFLRTAAARPRLWRDHPGLLAHYQKRFRYILVDEFQDTNAVQYAWLRLLGKGGDSLMVVGDDDQSIYGWRGAKIENIHQYSADFPDAVTIRLEQNYRSTAGILKAANALIANNTGRLGKELWTDGGDGEAINLYAAFNEHDEARYVVEPSKRAENRLVAATSRFVPLQRQSRVLKKHCCVNAFRTASMAASAFRRRNQEPWPTCVCSKFGAMMQRWRG